jgi:predicted nucleic acid-binding protein
MIVIDASAVLEILRQSQEGLDIESRVDGCELHAPHIIDLEVLQTLRRWENQGTMTKVAARAALEVFQAMLILRYPHTNMVNSIWALRHNLTAYDASYLVLARSLGAELITTDGGLRKAATHWIH